MTGLKFTGILFVAAFVFHCGIGKLSESTSTDSTSTEEEPSEEYDTSTQPVDHDAVAKALTELLGFGIQKNKDDYVLSRDKRTPPIYVQRLYENLKNFRPVDGRKSARGSNSFGGKNNGQNLILQAIICDNMTNDNGRYFLSFNLQDLRISDHDLKSADIVLSARAKRFSSTLAAYEFRAVLPDDPTASARFSRRSEKGNFLKADVTQQLRNTVFAKGLRRVSFELVVRPASFSDTEFRRLLRTWRRDQHAPVLVFHSNRYRAKEEPTSAGGDRFSARRPRSVQNGPDCDLRKWVIDMPKLFPDYVFMNDLQPVGYCAGACRGLLVGDVWNASYNARFRAIFNAKPENGGSRVPAPACVPASYLPTNIFYLDGKVSSAYFFESLIAESCMCV